jgi:S-DNA-T family DNA segregation ATPase FtsK/SpoIIIE
VGGQQLLDGLALEAPFAARVASLRRLIDALDFGRAVGIIVVAATQRLSSDIIPTSLRDLFAWRFAGRCTTDVSSDIVLGHGWKDRGWSANTISPTNPGAGLLIAEGGVPQFIKAAYLSDHDCTRIADYAARLRLAYRPDMQLPAAG